MFSRRAHWSAPINRLTVAREELARRGVPVLDLTESNPTRADLPYPLDELSAAMAQGARASYAADPAGIPSAREALGQHLGCDPGDLILTSSTSEAYSFLFKLLCDAGDNVLTAVPSYPLFEHLANLEQLALHSFPLDLHHRWEIHPDRLRSAIDDRTKAIVVVSPNNPTGSYVTAEEHRILSETNLPLIADEVFRDFAFIEPPPALVSDHILTFSLGGLSKSAGLPHYKLGWIRVSGPLAVKREALAALELIADNFLSLATPVQVALPDLLRLGATIAGAIRERTSLNLAALREAVAKAAGLEVLPVEGGWSAVLRVPRLQTDEELALMLLEKAGVAVHPGYFFDFATDGFLVLSLLTPSPLFTKGIERIIATL